MIKVAALTPGESVPSARFRVRQHIDLLWNFGFEVREYVPAIDSFAPMPDWPESVNPKLGLPFNIVWSSIKLSTRAPGILRSWQSQITWLQRELLPRHVTLEPLLKQPLVFDVDDAIWLVGPFAKRAARMIAQRAEVVVAGNSYLANWFVDHTKEVRVVPTAIDTERFRPLPPEMAGQNERFIVGWTGTYGNLPYLEAIEGGLRQFLEMYTDTEILIISDRPPAFKALPVERVRYLPWSIDIEAQAVQRMDVGLMPLPDDDWTRGKCSFKMLQYMASGVPAIVSPVGTNAEILATGKLGLPATEEADWYEALVFFYENRARARDYGRTGRSIAERFFSREVISSQLAQILSECGPGSRVNSLPQTGVAAH